eukprot:6013783-Alexandrium_andersonii.AAC.1
MCIRDRCARSETTAKRIGIGKSGSTTDGATQWSVRFDAVSQDPPPLFIAWRFAVGANRL